MRVRLDHDRPRRIGQPEAILCEGKALADLDAILGALPGRPTLLTRLAPERHAALAAPPKDYDPASRTAIVNGCLPARTGRVRVVTAGTGDLPVALEALRTLRFGGLSPDLIADIGVAGLWRLEEQIESIRDSDAVIVVAGMDGALVSVIGGLVGVPVIGVPTSVGYGAAEGGRTALNAMLASCAQGVLVCNIDNGFGAASAVLRILEARAR
ncbi:circadian phase modifier CpmA [Rhodovulum viride]|uniref:Circadian phase modifier CpmA n=1 Tax=Rhodovulum viride TaxID=1231134 RepID=A0ABX9DJ21_9RHOB|nr:nickel pincer cofactor biosynthesis protein LarB [Rhodovulum viride]RAP41659.1 circadian phase modifier CpmA [Rhodovulum viride]